MALSIDPNLAGVGEAITLEEAVVVGPPAAAVDTEAGNRRNKLLELLKFLDKKEDAAAVVMGAILNLGGEEGGIIDICENFVVVEVFLMLSLL